LCSGEDLEEEEERVPRLKYGFIPPPRGVMKELGIIYRKMAFFF
jgi:hypothetical protein